MLLLSGFERYLQLCHLAAIFNCCGCFQAVVSAFVWRRRASCSGSTPHSSYIQGCRYGATLLCVEAVHVDHLRCGYIHIANEFCLRCLVSYKLACTLHHELCTCVTRPVSRQCHQNFIAGCCCLGAIVGSWSGEACQRQASPLVMNSVYNVQWVVREIES